jgi:dTDP-4-amino-4,6-dideoxygalactose transaminase
MKYNKDGYILPWSGRGINYTDEDINIVLETMRIADPLTQGLHLEEFQEIFSKYHSGVPSFAVSSGAAALEISADLIDIKPGDEIIIPAHTYVASAIPFARRGAKLVWADIDIDTRVVTAETISDKITKKTKAIVPVHLYGLCVEMEEIMKLVENTSIWVIEDCAQALGASYNGKKCGTFGHISIYSFHAQKAITTLGEGGMICTKDIQLTQKIPGLRHNGHKSFDNNRKYYWQPAMSSVDFDIENVWPHNFSIGEVQCALGINLMKRVDKINNKRVEKVEYIINRLLDYSELEFQKKPRNSTNVYTNLCLMYENPRKTVNRDALIQILSGTFKIQPVVQNYPLYRYPLMKKAGYGLAECPNTDLFFDNMLSLPFYEWFSNEQIEYLIDSVKKAVVELR